MFPPLCKPLPLATGYRELKATSCALSIDLFDVISFKPERWRFCWTCTETLKLSKRCKLQLWQQLPLVQSFLFVTLYWSLLPINVRYPKWKLLFFLDIGSRDETNHIYTKTNCKFELFGLNNQYLHEVERGATVSVGDLVKIGGTHTFWSIVCKASDWNMKMISNTLQVQ